MPNKLAHFAIEADDVDRARSFYERGPPGFYRIHGAGTQGALQQRSGPSEPGCKGFECSFAVEDLNASVKLIEAAGGKMLGPKHEIPNVGNLAQFHDTESNQAIIIQYTPEVLNEIGLS